VQVNRKRNGPGVVYHSGVVRNSLNCWFCEVAIDPSLLDYGAVLVPRSESRGGPVLVLRCGECGTDNVAERNRAGEHFLIPPVLADFRDSNVRGGALARARKWARENALRRADFRRRSVSLPKPMPSPGDTPEPQTTPEERDLPSRSRGAELNSVLDAYGVLGLELTAAPSEIRNRYRELSKKCHPDRVADLDEEIRRTAERRFREIRKAYDMLAGD